MASCLGFDSEWPMDEYLIVVCGIMLFGGQLDSDRLVSSFVSVECKLAGMQLYVGECVWVCGVGGGGRVGGGRGGGGRDLFIDDAVGRS